MFLDRGWSELAWIACGIGLGHSCETFDHESRGHSDQLSCLRGSGAFFVTRIAAVICRALYKFHGEQWLHIASKGSTDKTVYAKVVTR